MSKEKQKQSIQHLQVGKVLVQMQTRNWTIYIEQGCSHEFFLSYIYPQPGQTSPTHTPARPATHV